MRVKLLVGLAGSTFAYAGGDMYECDDATAARFVAAGIAVYEPAPPATVVEAAATPGAPERAVKPRGRARG